MSLPLIDGYLSYVSGIRRYSPRTQAIYRDVLDRFFEWLDSDNGDGCGLFTRQTLRSYEVHLLDEKGESPRTVNLHLSVLSGFFRYLMKEGKISANPVRLISRPKTDKRLPLFYRQEAMEEYFRSTDYYVSDDFLGILLQTQDRSSYKRMLIRLIIRILYGTGIRRAELIDLKRSSIDFSRSVLHVHGKGDKTRDIPVIPSLSKEISLYLTAVSSFICRESTPQTPLLLTPDGGKLYPVFVDRVIKDELGGIGSITGQKSPHVLRHTIASELLGGGTDLNSIKEFLGHSSLAATQVYTHSTIERLQSVYNNAHPRAKNGGNNGD